jgi:hypothetical protein
MVPFDVGQSIAQKKARYGRYVDSKQWSKFHEIMLHDARLDFWDIHGNVVMVGKDPLSFKSCKAFVDFFSLFLANAETLHMFGPGDLEQTSADEVKAIWSMEDQIYLKSTNLVEIRGGGFYYETWKLKDGEWYLKSLDLKRTYTKISDTVRVSISTNMARANILLGQRWPSEGQNVIM